MDPFTQNFGEAYGATLPTLAEAMGDVLRLFGCQRIYGVGGDYAANLIQAFDGPFELLPSSNEMHAGFSACATAELKGFGVCLVTYTVGSLPCATAAALAKAERLPVIFISGAPGEAEAEGKPLHHVVQSADDWRVDYDAALNAFKALGLRAERLAGHRSPGQPGIAGEQFFRLVAHAFEHQEPVFVEVPRDLVFSRVQAIALPESPEAAVATTRVLTGGRLIAREIAERLRRAKKPLLYFGVRIKFNHALIALVREFCQRHRIPYASGVFAKGILDELDPLSLGTYNGAFSPEATRAYIEREADYILEICTPIHAQDTASAFATQTHVIESFPNKTSLKGTASRCTDVLEVFQHLMEEDLPVFEESLPARAEAPVAANEPLGFHNLADTLNALQARRPEALIYLPEVGNSFFASFSLATRAAACGRSWLTNPWYAAMGTSLPYARALCNELRAAGHGDAPVVVTGDGGFHFQANDLIHFLKENHFAVILLLRNEIFHLGKCGDGKIYHCSTEGFDARKLVEAYGGTGWRCETAGALTETMGRLLDRREGLHIIEIPVPTTPEAQSREIRLLNLYIQARSGKPEAMAAWEKVR